MKQLYEDRRHLENLLNTRFNFFIAVFASIIASFFAVKNLNQLILVLVIGTFLEILLAITIARAQIKVNFFLKEIRKNKKHSEHHANEYANNSKNFLIKGSRNSIIGYYIPVIISITLLFSTVFSKYIFETVIESDKNQPIEIKRVNKKGSTKTFILNINQKTDTTKN